eukprot:m.244215 g.244215  ORF g.244215 m.244215 type:complete len:164 (+) comp17464_c0_seq1:3586-4077(+)
MLNLLKIATGTAIGAGVAAVAASGRPSLLDAHCQVPCGIYDDDARVGQLKEDAVTIGKATTEIEKLTKSGVNNAQNLNQAVRWIATKDQHASDIITTVSEYFLTQKVKEAEKGDKDYTQYLEVLAAHHRVMRAAMKTKQQVSSQAVADLNHAVGDLSKVYGGH